MSRVPTGNHRSAGGAAIDGRSSPLPCDSFGGGGGVSPVPAKRESFHISNDPNRDVCAASVKKMEAFGADGEEITRQVYTVYASWNKHNNWNVRFGWHSDFVQSIIL